MMTLRASSCIRRVARSRGCHSPRRHMRDSCRRRSPQARLRAREGDADGAEKLLLRAAELAPSDPEPPLVLGNVAGFLRRDAAAAEQHYIRSLKIEPRWDAHYFLAKARGDHAPK